MPEIPFSVALLLIPIIGVLAFVLMSLVAGAWIALARFVVSGFGVFSQLSRWLFQLAYGKRSDTKGQAVGALGYRAKGYRWASGDVVRMKNRLKSLYRSRGVPVA
jgi:hypothetical protein